MSASIGMLGGARAQAHLRQILVHLSAYVVNAPEVLVNYADEKFDEEGRLKDEEAKAYTRQLLENLIRLTEMLMARAESQGTSTIRKLLTSQTSRPSRDGSIALNRARDAMA